LELKPFEIIQVYLRSGNRFAQDGFSEPYLLLVKDATTFNDNNTRAIIVFDMQTLTEYKVFLRAAAARGIDALLSLGRIQILPGIRLLGEWNTSDKKELAIIDLSKPLD